MKRCDNCQNEATVFYQVTVNGKTEQKHLCAECAKKEGVPMDFGLFEPSMSLFDDRFFEMPGLFGAAEKLFDSAFAPTGTFGSLFALPGTQEETKKPEPAKAPAAEDRQSGAENQSSETEPVRTPTSLAGLKAQLKRAVKQEDYLRAAALRDRIRAMEGGKPHEK